jgi:hypothetical protein
MTLQDYYNILGLTANPSSEEIKKAYRKKARLYHPDINPSPEAKDLFISATEAYEFLLTYREKIITDEQAYQQVMEDWRKYRQDRTRKRATSYAGTSYNNFRKTKFYKTTRIFDGTTLIFSFFTSIIVISYTIYGYTYRLKHPFPGIEKPSLFAFIMLLVLGVVFLIVSLIYLKAYQENSQKHRKKY